MLQVFDHVGVCLLVIGIGFGWLYLGRIYRQQYEKEFNDDPGKRMGLDVLWTIIFNRAPIVGAVLGPFFGWFLIVVGVIRLADLAFFGR